MKKFFIILLIVLGSIGIAGWFAYNFFLSPESHTCALHKDIKAFTHTNFPRHIPFRQKNGFINDISCLNQTPVYGIVDVRTIDNIRDALAFARENNLNVSTIGVRHSMGGQAFYTDAIILDMSNFDGIELDMHDQTITVQTGATWKQIQEFLHPYQLSVKAMQSSNIFSVGGSISVNAHGMDHRIGSVANTVKSLRIMLADGSIKTLSPAHEKEFFNLVVGGYGLFGVVLDAIIEVTPNLMYQEHKYTSTTAQLPGIITDVLKNPEIEIFYAHLSTSPVTFLDHAIVFTYKPYTKDDVEIPPLQTPKFLGFKRMLLNLSKTTFTGKLAKWVLEKYFNECEVRLEKDNLCLISRNAVMYDSVEYTQSNMQNQTDILHEYFIPQTQLVSFINQMKSAIKKHKAILLNCSIRLVHQEHNFLSYAKHPLIAIVLYLNQSISQKGNADMADLTRSLIDIAHAHNGTFFLPYQLHFTYEQLVRAYPQWPAFVKEKKKHDPTELFTQRLYEMYKVKAT